MRVIFGIVLFVLCLLFDVSSLFAGGVWKEGEIRSKQKGRDLISVEFTGIEGNICVVGLVVGPNAQKGSASFYVFPEGESDEDNVVIDEKERKIFFRCKEGEITLFIDETEFI